MNVKSVGFRLILRYEGVRATAYTVHFDDRPASELQCFNDDPDCQASRDFDALDAMLGVALDRLGFRSPTHFSSPDKYQWCRPVAALRFEGGPLRLYCCHYGSALVILGSGGPKARNVGELHNDPRLAEAFERMQVVARRLERAIADREIRIADNAILDYHTHALIEDQYFDPLD